MSKYIVTYDLNSTGQDYDALISAIKKLDYCPMLKSAWLVKSTSSASEIYNYLRPKIDDNDRLFISEIPSNHMGWLDQAAIEFLR